MALKLGRPLALIEKVLAALLLTGLGVAGASGWQMFKAAQWNQRLADEAGLVEAAQAAASTPAIADTPPPEWRFALAQQLGEQGQLDAALARYRSLFDDPRLGVAARYNSANLLLREGRRQREAGEAAPALVLLELAKEAYRGVLRLEPGHWDARYNLERAQRLLPDPTPQDLADGAAPEQSERAATTMRGVSKGLP